jgi:hypothetical protein
MGGGAVPAPADAPGRAGHRRSMLGALRIRAAALVTGGSLAGFVAVHAVHAAAAGGSVVIGFVCNVVR